MIDWSPSLFEKSLQIAENLLKNETPCQDSFTDDFYKTLKEEIKIILRKHLSAHLWGQRKLRYQNQTKTLPDKTADQYLSQT